MEEEEEDVWLLYVKRRWRRRMTSRSSALPAHVVGGWVGGWVDGMGVPFLHGEEEEIEEIEEIEEEDGLFSFVSSTRL